MVATLTLARLAETLRDALGARALAPATPERSDVLVVFPESAEAVQLVARACRGAEVPLVGSAAGSPAPLAGVRVVTSRMRRILELDPVDGYAVVEPGVTAAALDRAAALVGLRLPVDTVGDRHRPLGECLATPVRRLVAGVQVCDVDGELIWLAGTGPAGVVPVPVPVAGYVTVIELRLCPDDRP